MLLWLQCNVSFVPVSFVSFVPVNYIFYIKISKKLNNLQAFRFSSVSLEAVVAGAAIGAGVFFFSCLAFLKVEQKR